jgi:hypothetical protein
VQGTVPKQSILLNARKSERIFVFALLTILSTSFQADNTGDIDAANPPIILPPVPGRRRKRRDDRNGIRKYIIAFPLRAQFKSSMNLI